MKEEYTYDLRVELKSNTCAVEEDNIIDMIMTNIEAYLKHQDHQFLKYYLKDRWLRIGVMWMKNQYKRWKSKQNNCQA